MNGMLTTAGPLHRALVTRSRAVEHVLLSWRADAVPGREHRPGQACCGRPLAAGDPGR
ncbi:hypothetical protein ACWEQL_17875 [Kitasatospora sp. NPDC004240]